MGMNNPESSKPLLLVRPTPDAREGTIEYLQRLAKRNGLQRGKDIATLLGVPFSHILRHSPDKIRSVINGTDPVASLCLRASIRSIGGTVGISSSARVCSSCLSESDILSANWSFPLSISCEKHKTVLLDKCPKCLSKIQRNLSHYRCQCGLDFREVNSQPAPQLENSYYELFAPWRIQSGVSASTTALLQVEALAGRITRRLIRARQQEQQIATFECTESPNWWLRSTDHRHLEKLCHNDESLAETTLRLFPRFTNTSTNLYACQTAAITVIEPRVLQIARELEAKKVAAKKAKVSLLFELLATFDANSHGATKLMGNLWDS